MKILFLSHYFPPEVNAPATRTYEHCKRWVELGHEVTVVSCVPHHPMGRAYPGYKNRLYQTEVIDGIKVVRLLTYITANEGFLKRSVNYVFFMLMCVLSAPFLDRPNIVISTSPQFFNGLAGYFVSRLKRARWILEIRDLWPESILAVGAVKSPRLINVLEWIERFAYRKADHIVAVTKAFKRHIQQRGIEESKISVIRNGVDLDLFSPVPRDTGFDREHGLEGKFVAAYVGTHGMAHGLDVILTSAELLRDDPDIVFLMVGDGAEREPLQLRRDEKGLANVIMLGQKPKQMMPVLLATSDVSLVLLRKLELFKTVIPSKIFESMASGKPIILGVEGESAEIINDSGAGLCIAPESAEALADAIRKLKEERVVYDACSASGRNYVAKHFERRVLADRFAALFQRVVNGRTAVNTK